MGWRIDPGRATRGNQNGRTDGKPPEVSSNWHFPTCLSKEVWSQHPVNERPSGRDRSRLFPPDAVSRSAAARNAVPAHAKADWRHAALVRDHVEGRLPVMELLG